MGKARLEFDYAAFGELRNDPEVHALWRQKNDSTVRPP